MIMNSKSPDQQNKVESVGNEKPGSCKQTQPKQPKEKEKQATSRAKKNSDSRTSEIPIRFPSSPEKRLKPQSISVYQSDMDRLKKLKRSFLDADIDLNYSQIFRIGIRTIYPKTPKHIEFGKQCKKHYSMQKKHRVEK